MVTEHQEERFRLGYQAAEGTLRGTLSCPGRPIRRQDFGQTSPDNYPDTYWYIAGWNAAVEELHPGGV